MTQNKKNLNGANLGEKRLASFKLFNEDPNDSEALTITFFVWNMFNTFRSTTSSQHLLVAIQSH